MRESEQLGSQVYGNGGGMITDRGGRGVKMVRKCKEDEIRRVTPLGKQSGLGRKKTTITNKMKTLCLQLTN